MLKKPLNPVVNHHYNANSLDAWFEAILQGQPTFIRALCQSLRHESLLIRMPTEGKVCKYGTTSEGRVCTINEEDPAATLADMPALNQMLALDDAEYHALVEQEAPGCPPSDRQNNWRWVVAAFKRTGGNIPHAEPEAELSWKLFHIYGKDAMEHPKHYTQSAGLAAVHPIVFYLMEDHPCILLVMKWRAFKAFQYDPTRYFASGGHDDCGFVNS